MSLFALLLFPKLVNFPARKSFIDGVKGKAVSNKILVADQDPEVREMVATVLVKEGYSPVVVVDGGEAYRRLQSDADFEAGIFDTRLPHIDGLDLVRYMKTEKRLMRIPVMITGSEGDLQLMAKSFGAGATVFLSKPLTSSKLEATLRLFLSNGPTAHPRARAVNS